MDRDLEGILFFAAFVITIGSFTALVKAWIKSRGDRAPASDQRLDAISHQLSQLATAVDATALEVERISEGQRFTTKLLSERGLPVPADQRRGGGPAH